jgi:hypothetical protein
MAVWGKFKLDYVSYDWFLSLYVCFREQRLQRQIVLGEVSHGDKDINYLIFAPC